VIKISNNIIIIFLFLNCYASLFEKVIAFQQPNKKLADQFEQNGQFKLAADYYIAMLKENTKDIPSYLGAKRCLMRLGEMDQLYNLIISLQKTYRNVRFEVDLAEIQYKKNYVSQAIHHWKNIIEENSNDHQAYALVGAMFVDYQLFDEALEVYQRARRNFRDDSLFTFEICHIYIIQLNYESLISEYLNYLGKFPDQLEFIDSQIAQLNLTQDALNALAGELLKYLKKHNFQMSPIHYLLAGIYLRNNDYQQALNQYVMLERIRALEKDTDKSQGGAFLFEFAELALRNAKYLYAQQAYQELIRIYTTTEFVQQAKLGLAKVLEAQSFYLDAVHAYEIFINEYPNAQEVPEVLLKIGDLWLNELNNVDNAEKVYTKLVRDYASNKIFVDGYLHLAECAIISGKLDKAREIYEKLKSSNKGRNYKVLLRTAYLEFYLKHPTKALKCLDPIIKTIPKSKNIGTELEENDLLKLFLVLEENRQDSVGLAILGEAELYAFQRQYNLGCQLIENYLPLSTNNQIKDELFLVLADLYQKLKVFDNAIVTYVTISNNAQSIYRDLAIKNCADIYETDLRNFSKAQEYYERLLMEFPESIFCEHARNEIRLMKKMN
jgi:tetratricopeptide (TPR) repeat protein